MQTNQPPTEFTYTVIISIDLRTVSPEVMKVMDSINKTFASITSSGENSSDLKIQARSERKMILRSNRLFTDAEKQQIVKTIEQEFRIGDGRVESFKLGV